MKSILFSLMLLSSAVSFAQKKEWKEMQSFHEVMSKTFHPAEDGNLQPTKDNIDELLKRAKAWQASTPPAGYNKKAVKPVLDKLVKQTEGIKDSIAQGASDTDLKKAISTAHDTFHEIMEKCKK